MLVENIKGNLSEPHRGEMFFYMSLLRSSNPLAQNFLLTYRPAGALSEIIQI
jgi:hypothetical protein